MESVLGHILKFLGDNKYILLHVLSGILLSIISVFSVSLAVVAILIGAAGKEVYDLITKKGTPEVKDFLATLFGGLLGIVILLLFGFIA